MLRLKRILRATPKKIHDNSKHCLASITNAEILVDDNGVFKFFRGTSINPPPPGPWDKSRGPYSVLAKIYIDPDDKKADNPKVFIWCDCDWFKYNCETALAIQGSSAILNSNGNLPKITNPTGKGCVCKHCLAFLRKAMIRKKFFNKKNPTVQLDEKIAKEMSKKYAGRKPIKIRKRIPGAIKTNAIVERVKNTPKNLKKSKKISSKPKIKLTNHRK